MRYRHHLIASAAMLLGQAATSAHAQATATAQSDQTAAGTEKAAQPKAPSEIVITARRLDEARASVQPSLGATSYSITGGTIQALPGGENQQLNQVLLQLPGVVQDGFGQFHVRDDHNNLQYRINGTILPEGLAVFGQTLSPRLVDRLSLLTGALPAQYGLRTAGIIDITTKSGLFDNGGQVGIYGGSFDTVQPSFNYGGHSGSTNFFVSGDYRHSARGIEGVDSSVIPLHDKTNQYQAFAYVDHIIDNENRISFVGGYSNQWFQIPNPRGLNAAVDGPGYSVGGRTAFASEQLNETQLEKTGFGQFAYLHDAGPLTLQASAFARYSSLDYRPDVLGELLFNGQAQRAAKRDFTVGTQLDFSYRVSTAHTIRGGALITRDHGTSRTTTQVFPVDNTGAQSGEPIGIVDNGGATEWTYSAYLQDEWRPLKGVTVNFGGRFDHYDGYRSESQFSPRVNIVFQPATGTTIHAGYARYFSPAPFELVASPTIAKFLGTSAAPTNVNPDGTVPNTTPFAERQNYFDIGFQQVLGGGITFGIDAFHRRSRNLIDEGQFGAPIILTPFNYARGRIDGVEGNISYNHAGWLIYGNIAYARAKGLNIVSSEFNFSPDDLAYIRNNYIFLDHDQRVTGSGGIFYAFTGGLQGLKLGSSFVYGSGLRRGLTLPDGTKVPNGAHIRPYAQVNLTASYRLAKPGIELRFDVINVGDHVYEIRDGSGVGVGAPQYGPRRGFFVGISKSL